MRKKFVYYILIPVLIVCVVVYLFIDRWVTLGLEAAGEALVGAKVEITGLHVGLFPIGLRWEGMQVANGRDPWKNLFQTGKVQFAMDFGQLLRGKYIIETMEVNDLILGTKRTTDGSIPKKSEPPASSPAGPSYVEKAQKAFAESNAGNPLIGNLDELRHGVNADSLVRILNIQSIKNLDSLRRQVLSSSQQWDASMKDVEDSRKKLDQIGTNLKAIDPASLKGVDKIAAAISTVDNSVKEVNQISQTFGARKASIEGDIQKISGSVGNIDDIAARDFQNLLQMAKLPNLSTSGIARMLVGQEMYNRGLTYLSWIDMARGYAAKYRPEPPKDPAPPRMRGQDIAFAVERSYPKFWIKKILISGGTDSAQNADYIRAKGEALNIASDQKATGVPLTVALQGVEGGGRGFALSALFDRTKDVPFDRYYAHLENTPLAAFQLGKEGFLQGKIANARMNSSVEVKVPGDKLDCSSTIDFRNVTVQFDNQPRNTVEGLVRGVLTGIKGFDVSLRLWTTGEGMDVALATNLDDQIAAGVKGVVGEEFTKLQNKLKSALDEKIGEKRKEFDQVFNTKKDAIEKQLTAVQGLVSQNLGMVDAKKKELTDKLEKEKKGQVNNALKKLFK